MRWNPIPCGNGGRSGSDDRRDSPTHGATLMVQNSSQSLVDSMEQMGRGQKHRSLRDNAQGHSATRSRVQKVIFITWLEKCAKLRGASRGDKSSCCGAFEEWRWGGLGLRAGRKSSKFVRESSFPDRFGVVQSILPGSTPEPSCHLVPVFFYSKTGALPHTRP